MNSKLIIYLKAICKTIKLLEDNMGLLDLVFNKGYLEMTPKEHGLLKNVKKYVYLTSLD